MPDHLHFITDGARKRSDPLRFIKGIAAHRIIQYLKDGGFQSSLQKLRGTPKADRYEYSLWQHDSNVMLLTAESTLMQRVHYIHQNPVRARLVQQAEEYRWSSVRYWKRCFIDHEPLPVDVDQSIWRAPR